MRNIFTRIGRGAKSWLDIYHRGARLAVTGRIRDIGQSVLQSSFQTGSSSSPGHCPIFCLIVLLETDYTKIYNNYTMNLIIICIDDSNEIMNNNYERPQDLILLFKISMGTRKNFFGNLRKIWACALGVVPQSSPKKSPCRKWKLYMVIHKSLRDFRPLRYSSREGHAEVKHVNRGRDTPSFCPTLQVLDMSTLGDAADVNPVR